MSEFTVMPVICWEEWCAIFHTVFKKQNNPGIYGEDVINKASYLKGLEYLEGVLKRDKYKNNLSLGYTADFLRHFSTLDNLTSSKSSFSSDNSIVRLIGLDVVRFSSQMADMCQKKNVKSINNMLGEIGMKEHDFIAEVRHALTHKQLPSMLLVQRSLSYLIGFIYEKYWLEQYSQLTKSDLIDEQLLQKYLRVVLGGENAAASTTIATSSVLQMRTSVKRMSNIIADNVATFRRRLNHISLLFVKNYDGETDLIQIDNLKRKKHHLAYFLSELFRIALRISFYESHIVQKEEKDLILLKITKIILDISQDDDFKKAFMKVSQISYLKYKFNRIDLLSEVFIELKPLKNAIDKIFGINESQKSQQVIVNEDENNNNNNNNDKQNVNQSDNQSNGAVNGSHIELNKFGAFTLKINHIPSLLGKKLIETI